ncbi:hypothetical protein SynMVIR181_00655 [Synechococcus sp. MVIR-18-1]|nr:hypothetical protein SynMVIR181_00655 [Synechococcus sp. MVIR-18-1]
MLLLVLLPEQIHGRGIYSRVEMHLMYLLSLYLAFCSYFVYLVIVI